MRTDSPSPTRCVGDRPCGATQAGSVLPKPPGSSRLDRRARRRARRVRVAVPVQPRREDAGGADDADPRPADLARPTSPPPPDHPAGHRHPDPPPAQPRRAGQGDARRSTPLRRTGELGIGVGWLRGGVRRARRALRRAGRAHRRVRAAMRALWTERRRRPPRRVRVVHAGSRRTRSRRSGRCPIVVGGHTAARHGGRGASATASSPARAPPTSSAS